MKPGDVKIFVKSGNKVRLVEETNPKKEEWRVERIDGQSKGKQMICRATALIDSHD